MIPVPSDVRVWLAVGRTDMRRGMNGLALQVREALGRDPHAGDLYVFRGARGDLIKIVWHVMPVTVTPDQPIASAPVLTAAEKRARALKHLDDVFGSAAGKSVEQNMGQAAEGA